MSENETVPFSSPLAILLSSYASGATQGNRLGTAGYSYDFVARLFAPLLQRLGKLVEVKSARELSAAIQDARRENLEPVHVTFRPFQDAHLAADVRNVVVPAWEFPDIPNDAFDGNPQNNWVETANRCSLVLVGGPFTANAMNAAGVTTPVRIVPVPTAEAYFQLAPWDADYRTTLDCSPYVLQGSDAMTHTAGTDRASAKRRLGEAIRASGRQTYRNVVRPCIPRRIEPVVSAALHAGISAWREQSLPCRNVRGLSLGGIVYTSIFNPDDGRKNWEDMITAFLHALGDCDDATLVLKLITSNRRAIHRVLSFYRRLDIAHRCRVAVIPDYLSDADMLELARASAFYLTTTRAEGNCLPVMDYLAAGRPCVSPSHTAIADYFDSEVGFVVQSHPEPCSWPQDSRHRWRSTWQRLVWPSLVEQIRCSYQIAKKDQAAHRAMAEAARERMLQWSHPEAVWPHLRSAIELLASDSQPATIRITHKTRPKGDSPIFGDTKIGTVPRQRPMRAVVSLLNFRPGKIGGTETYLRQLIARLPSVDRQSEIVLLMDRDLAAENIFPGVERAVVDLSARQVLCARGLEAVSGYRARDVEKTLERLQPDVVFFPQQSIFPKNVEAPCVLVVHDLYHIFLPQHLTPGQRLFRQRSYASSIARADRIISISQFTRKSVLEHYDVAAERISVVPHGWDSCGAAVSAAGAGETPAPQSILEQSPSGRYLYYPAITRPHKNHQVLLESIAALRSQGRFDCELVLSGIQTSHWRTLRKQIRRLDLEQTVRHVGYVSYDRVRQLYRDAECVVFPSSFEGFGLPVMEACEVGKKIVVSRLEVFDELGVPKRFQIDFANPDELHRALGEPGVTVLEKRPWTWDESAAATMAVLSSAAGRQQTVQPLARAA